MKTSARRNVSGELSAGWSALSALPLESPADLAAYVTLRDICRLNHIFDVCVKPKDASITVQSAPITGENQLHFQASEETYYFASTLVAQTIAIEMFALERKRTLALTR